MNLLDMMNSYPWSPGWKARNTAQAAADAVKPKASLLRDKCIEALKVRPMTADECAAYLNVDKLSVRPRFSELAAQNRIIDTQDRRLNESQKRAIVWRIC